MTSLYKSVDGSEIELRVPGYGNGAPVLKIDIERMVAIRVATGEELDFSTDTDARLRRPEVEYVPSEVSNKEYQVYKPDISDIATWICTCPDFAYRRINMNATCKHIGYAYYGGYERIDLS